MAKKPASPVPRLTRAERTALNQVLWARRVLREAPAERLQLADRVEAWEQMTGLAARGAHKAGVAQQLNDRRP